MTDTFVRSDQDRDEEEPLGLWARIGVYSVGLSVAMAIFFWGAVPSFRTALDDRLDRAGGIVDGSALGQAMVDGEDLLPQVRRALDADIAGRAGGPIAGQSASPSPTAARSVRVSAVGDVVTLRGSVPSEAERARLGAVALAVDGVGRVENLLVVQDETASGAGEAAASDAVGTAARTEVVEDGERAATGAANADANANATQPTTSPAVVTRDPATTVTATPAPTTAAPTTSAAPATTAVVPTTATATATGGDGAAGPAAEQPAAAAAEAEAEAAAAAAAEAEAAAARGDAQAQLNQLLADEPLLFDTSSPELRSESYATVDRIAELLALVPTVAVEIQGHTDDIGPADANLLLSDDRAGRVRNELIARGIDPARLTAIGYGMATPTVPNDSEENRQRNRRIQLVLS